VDLTFVLPIYFVISGIQPTRMKKRLLVILALSFSLSIIAQDFSTDSVPVRLKYIKATQQNNNNKLEWSVACLLDFARFDIQRSSDGVRYTSIYQFQADKTRCLYAFEHDDKNGSGRLFYRIRVGDLDGRYFTSKTVIVYGREKGFEITSISPNVIQTGTYLSVSSATADRVESIITDVKGNIIRRRNYTVQTGNNDLYLDLSFLQKGIYFITLINQSGQKKGTRFVKQ
jgi:hypothetical protein